MLTLKDIEKLTLEYGDNWSYAHVCRLLKLIELLRQDIPVFDQQALLYATYLHDWGAFPKYVQAGVEHALRSRQVAENEILPQTDLPASSIPVVLEAIELHDYRNPAPVRSPEALLLREADFLDFLGAIGIAREFARGPRELRPCYERALSRKEGIFGKFTLPTAQRIAESRMAYMDQFLKLLEEESFGYL